MNRGLQTGALLALVLSPVEAQTAPDRAPQILAPNSSGVFREITRPYQVRPVAPILFRNSDRISSLMRAGKLYLSLQDAIALGIENNLDIELERFLPEIAKTDVLRASGGGALRGLSLLVIQPPPGIGGPNGPLLTNLTAGSNPAPLVNTNFSDLALITKQLSDLSVTGPIPESTGPPIPQYDPVISPLFSVGHFSTAQYNPFLVGNRNWLFSNSVNGNVSMLGGFSPGTQLSLTFDNTRMRTNAQSYTYNPLYNSSFGITITQPLLRGFGIDLNRRFIRIAKRSQEAADLIFRQQLIDTVAGIVRLYIDLVSLNEDVKVKSETVRLAERLYEDNKNQVEQGTLAPIEMTRALAQVAAARQALITAEGLVRQQELVVKTAMTRRGLANTAIREARVVTSTAVPVVDHQQHEAIEELLAAALRNRPDLAHAAIQVKNAEVSLQGALNALLPQVDLIGTLANGGLSGTVNPTATVPPGLDLRPGGYGAVLDQILRRNFPTYAIGVQLTLPLRNRVAQADAVRDQLQLRQTQVRRQQLEDQVRLEVANAYVSLEQSRAAYDAAVQSRVLQEQSVDVEQQKFAVGLSTNYLVIQYQTYLAQARSTEVAAKGAYAKAKTALERATGRILDTHHISFDEAYHGQVARPPDPIP